jgi:hypothetical protein
VGLARLGQAAVSIRAPAAELTLGRVAEPTLGPAGALTQVLVAVHTLDRAAVSTLAPAAVHTPVRAAELTQVPVGAPTPAQGGLVLAVLEMAIPTGGTAHRPTASKNRNIGMSSCADIDGRTD